MNIAVFAKKTVLHKDYGGLETQTKTLSDGLALRGHQLTIFSPRWELPAQEKKEGSINYVFVDCVYRMGPFFGFFGTFQKQNWINRSYEEFKKRHDLAKFDLILAQSSTGLGVIKHKNEFNIPVVSISHGTIIGEYKTFLSSMSLIPDFFRFVQNTGFTLKNFFRRQREFVHGSDRVICVSNFVKNSLIEETFAPDEKFVVINNGVDPTSSVLRSSTQSDKGLLENTAPRLLYVGQVIKSKGVEDLISILIDSRFNDVSIDVAGDGDYLANLKNKAQEYGVSERLVLKGKLNHDDVVALYNFPNVSAFVLPTKRFEGFPMVLAEAMFAGLPIIAYDIGGVSDAIIDGQTGFLIESGDIEKFKEKVSEVINDTSLRSRMSENAKRVANERFSLNVMINKYEKVFAEVLK